MLKKTLTGATYWCKDVNEMVAEQNVASMFLNRIERHRYE